MGFKAVESHMNGLKHKKLIESLDTNNNIEKYGKMYDERAVSTANNCTTATASSSGSATNVTNHGDIRCNLISSETLKSEVIWTLHTVFRHHSYNSSNEIGEIFRATFPDNQLAQTFACGEDKIAYLTKFGLSPFIKKQLVSQLGDECFTVMFDDSMNVTTKTKQLDLHIRFWVTDSSGCHVQSRYLGSQFLGHSTAADILTSFKDGTDVLNLRNLLSVSMDGPNVNLKFLDLIQQCQSNEYGKQLLTVRSCGLHTMHNAFKTGFAVWEIDKLLRSLYYLFDKVPAGRQDYMQLTNSSKFPAPFCGHRWLENQPVAERAFDIWDNICLYVDAVTSKKLPNPRTASYDVVAAAKKDPLIKAKLHFFLACSHTTDMPMIPFVGSDIVDLLRKILRRFVKKENLSVSAEKLCRVDPTDKETWLNESIGHWHWCRV